MEDSRGFWRTLRPDTVTAFSAVVIGICALAVSLYQTGIMRDQQSASVWPRLSAGLLYTGSEFALLVENMGIGPAQIRRIEVRVDARPARTWRDVLTGGAGGTSAAVSRASLFNRVIPAGQRVEALRVEGSAEAEEARSTFEHVQIRICYCSVFEDCWLLEENFGARASEPPRPVEECRASEEPAFID